jgi:hypothetical protein
LADLNYGYEKSIVSRTQLQPYDWIGSHPDTGDFNEKREGKAISVWVRN